jgi:hypothetical protein
MTALSPLAKASVFFFRLQFTRAFLSPITVLYRSCSLMGLKTLGPSVSSPVTLGDVPGLFFFVSMLRSQQDIPLAMH